MIEKIDPEKCTGCGTCVERCPLDTLGLDPFQPEAPPCQEACPAGVDTRAALHFLKLGWPEKAVELLRKALPFPAITGRLCYHPCESKCARRDLDKAVGVHSLEAFLGDLSIRESMSPLPLRHAAKVAVAGSGPGGLSAAYFLVRMGYRVSVFEAGPDIGGQLRSEVLKGRLSGEILERQIAWYQELGVDFQIKTSVGEDLTHEDLKDRRYRALVLATGPWPEGKDQLPGDRSGVFSCGARLSARVPLAKVIASARALCLSVDRYLKGLNPEEPADQKTVPVKNLPRKPVARFTGGGIQDDSNVSPEERMEREARRCLSCGSKACIAHPEECMTCFECEVVCPAGAIQVHPFKEVLPMTLALD